MSNTTLRIRKRTLVEIIVTVDYSNQAVSQRIFNAQGYKNTNGSQICIWFPFRLLDTVVSNSRQATVIVAEKQGRNLAFPSLPDESDNLHRCCP